MTNAESTASIIDRTQRCMEAQRHDYRHAANRSISVDLNLNESEQTSLIVVLREALAAAGIRMSHERVAENAAPDVEIPPTSHLGLMIDLYKRIDAARHGRKTWNRGR